MYFDRATMTISEIGNHGDASLSGDEFARDDRAKRIESAAYSLCDWVYEYNCDRGELGCRFNQEQRDIIARMCAVAMMHQFEHDHEAERELVADLAKEPF